MDYLDRGADTQTQTHRGSILVVGKLSRKRKNPTIKNERDFVYEVAGPSEALGIIKVLDRWPTDKVIGMGVFAKGYEGDAERFYVFANLNDPSVDESQRIRATLAEFGTATALRVEDVFNGNPRPHFTATGPGATVEIAIRAAYPDEFA